MARRPVAKLAAITRQVSQRIRALSQQIAAIALSPVEEEFFAEGDKMSADGPEDFSDLDRDFRPPSIWRQLTSWMRRDRRSAEA